jgi:hypothetical protein
MHLIGITRLFRYTVPLQEVLAFANRMLRIYEGLEAEASVCRMMVTITLLQLEGGDVVAVRWPTQTIFLVAWLTTNIFFYGASVYCFLLPAYYLEWVVAAG